MSGGTDAKHWRKLGIRCFGFAPLRLPADLDFTALFHGVDERVPTDALGFGARVLDRLLRPADAQSPPRVLRTRITLRRSHTLRSPPANSSVRESSQRPSSACSVSIRRASFREVVAGIRSTRYSY